MPRKLGADINRVYADVACSKCGSENVIKWFRKCGRIANCGRPNCTDCNDYISSNQVTQMFKCMNCLHEYSIISSL